MTAIAPSSLTVVYGVAGDQVTADGARVLLWSRCESPVSRWHCSWCDQPLANRGQLEMHLEAGGQHYLAVDCRVHGLEACEAAQ